MKNTSVCFDTTFEIFTFTTKWGLHWPKYFTKFYFYLYIYIQNLTCIYTLSLLSQGLVQRFSKSNSDFRLRQWSSTSLLKPCSWYFPQCSVTLDSEADVDGVFVKVCVGLICGSECVWIYTEPCLSLSWSWTNKEQLQMDFTLVQVQHEKSSPSSRDQEHRCILKKREAAEKCCFTDQPSTFSLTLHF